MFGRSHDGQPRHVGEVPGARGGVWQCRSSWTFLQNISDSSSEQETRSVQAQSGPDRSETELDPEIQQETKHSQH